MYKLYEPIKGLIDSAQGRKFTIKVGGNELTMEEASEQQRVIIADLAKKIAVLEKKISQSDASIMDDLGVNTKKGKKRILWVDDIPRNNSTLMENLKDQVKSVDVAISTDQGIKLFLENKYDLIISDMGRPEGDHAGIDLTKRVRELNSEIPIFIYCGSWAARNLREESLNAGVNEITASGSTLVGLVSSL
ncbi:response regulator [Giesbergeria sinuosa]